VTAPPKEIRNEIATTLDGRDITRPWVDRLNVNPPDDSVLLERGGGDYTLYREVLRDDHVMAALQQRRRAVIARPWEVRPGGKRAIDKAAADFLRANIETLGWDTICDKMLMGVFYGFAVGECLWAPDGRYWRLDAIRVRDRRRFGFDGENRLRLKTLQQPLGELLPEKKFWTFAAGADHDDAPYGLGLAHWLYWPVWFKRNGHRFWATYLERFGTPAAVGKYPAATPLADQTKLLEALRALRRDAAITVPEGMVIELLEATRSGTADYAAFVAQMNAAILVAAIGQTASTQGTPGKLGNDDTQNDVRLDIVKADADLLSASFNATVARWLTEWNFPGAAAPGIWRIIEEPEDLKARAERDASIYAMGYKPTARYIEETYGGEWEAVTPKPPEPPEPKVGDTAAAFAAPADADPVDAQVARLAPAADAEIARMVDTIQSMLDAADSLEEFRAMLEAAWPRLNSSGLADQLAEAMLAAELAGRAEVADGD
jgi:phage gp29-like protein